MSEKPSVSLILPCYNEEESVVETVERCARALEPLTSRFEIVVVDDASTDGSASLVERLARKKGYIRLVRNAINLGAGASLLMGFEAAVGDILIHDSMDLPLAPEDLPAILSRFPAADAVAVARVDRSAHSSYRKLTSLVNYGLLRLLFNVRLRDMNFVQAYKREAFMAAKVRARSPAFVTPELLMRIGRLGFKVEEIVLPFHRRVRGCANYGKVRDILWTLADMISFRLEN